MYQIISSILQKMKISPKRDILYVHVHVCHFGWNLPIIIIITSLVSLLHIHVHLYTPHVHVFIFMQEALYFKANILHMHIPVSHVSSRQVLKRSNVTESFHAKQIPLQTTRKIVFVAKIRIFTFEQWLVSSLESDSTCESHGFQYL